MVLPTGYTFNADGTCIYLTMAAIFIAQATNTPLTFVDQMILLGVFLLTSKGSAGVAGAGFVTLAATLTTIHSIPLVGLVLLLGIDRFLNEARAVTNLIGNGIGTIAIAKWDNSFDVEACEREIAAMKDEKRRARHCWRKSNLKRASCTLFKYRMPGYGSAVLTPIVLFRLSGLPAHRPSITRFINLAMRKRHWL